MEKEVKKLHPFNVMDQMIAHRLAMEGFEIINVIPSNKYADKAHFIFCFDSNAKFKKRFKEIKEEVEAAALSEADDLDKLRKELEDLKAENAKDFAEKSAKKSDENAEKAPENDKKSVKNVSKTSKSKANSEITDSADMKTVMDKLASLEALGNCILSNVSAHSFYEHLHGRSKEE